ncbi:TipAS antibiotic-recognition domain-containing protein [Paenibacillus catalpae]|uniref:TipAS antibiotic-recognition domain-containing protein n=1 Tax=Paenibacillus catalpae TaxID=1045775 RepID=A0A1I1UNB4_9BACL|nr:TipAS antibiotic-recognition domain-containing protein [Paenibacillus catalpae]
MNEQAAEAMTFMNAMASALTTGIRHHDQKINKLISDHLEFLNKHNHNVSAETFDAQTKFFLQDEFHLNMLES